jgi:hypothetical protein
MYIHSVYTHTGKQEHAINSNSNSSGKAHRTKASSSSTNSSGITVRARLLAARGACHLELSNPTDAMKDLQVYVYCNIHYTTTDVHCFSALLLHAIANELLWCVEYTDIL